MRIVLASDWFSEQMGYMENIFPRALSRLGHDVHVVTTTGQVYFTSPDYGATYGTFLGPPLLDPVSKPLETYTLHRLPPIVVRNRIGIRGFGRLVRKLAPAIVQTTSVASLVAVQSALEKHRGGYKLFTANHIHASVFPAASVERSGISLKDRLGLWLPGRLVAASTERCYAISPDAAEIATRFLGTPPQKVRVVSLGVDTEIFHPISVEADRDERRAIRKHFGWTDSDVVAVYSGRLTAAKDPLLLARAINLARQQGEASFQGLFIGSGSQQVDIEREGFPVVPFIPYRELPSLYRACDIGVWPRQESTSMLDAAAVGLPIVVSSNLKTPERTEGNGLTYSEGDVHDLARQLLRLSDGAERSGLGRAGARKIAETFGWDAIAAERVNEYEQVLKR